MSINHPLPTRRGLMPWFAGNHVAANLLMAVLMVGGFVVMLSMSVEVFPEIDPRTITVTVPYPGASPDEVEDGICRRVEEAITGIEGIKKIRSSANEGAARITAELEDDAKDRDVLDDIRSAVEQLPDFPPEDAEDPEYEDQEASSNVITLAVHGDVSERALREFAYRVRDDLIELPGVSFVDVTGVRPYEIAVEVREHDLRRYQLTFDEVARAVSGFSLDLPGGAIRADGGDILLRTEGQAYDRLDFERIVLRTNEDGTRLTVGDIATVVDGFEDQDLRSHFQNEPAAFVRISRRGAQRVLDIEGIVKEYIATASMPEGMSIAIASNSADMLRSRLSLLVRNGLMGLVLVFGCLVLFLELRLAFWTTMGIPISFLGAFVFIEIFNGSINMISLFAFILVLGIVVDDAIVIGESIFSHREQGKTGLQAAIDGTHEVLIPVAVAVITTAIAFVPLYFTPGIFGDILWMVPVVVVGVLMVSLIEVWLILPSHLSGGELRRATGLLATIQGWLRSGLDVFILRVYRPVLERAIAYRYVTLATAIATLLLTVGLVRGQFIRYSLFPAIDADEISATLEMPTGTAIARTEENLRAIVSAARDLRDEIDVTNPAGTPSIFKHVTATIGAESFGSHSPGQTASRGSPNIAEVTISLLDSEQRTISSAEVESRWRERIGEIPGAINLSFNSTMMSAGDDISVELAHDDFEQLLAAVERLKATLSEYAGVVEITDSFETGKRELRLGLTAEGVAAGLTLGNLGRQVRQAYYGEEAQRVQRGRDDIKVLIRYTAAERRSVGSILSMRIRLADGTEVPFSTVATIEEGRGYASIERSDRRRVVSVTAKVNEAVANASQLNRILATSVMPDMQGDQPGLGYSFEGAQREMDESLGGLVRALLVAVLGIFALLAVQLRSYVQPFIIMAAIPFGVVGAILGHMILGYSLSFFSLFGIVALAGVAINDSLVLLDKINSLRRDGVPLHDAVVRAGVRRLRPILFTSLTTCLGLSPMITEKSLQAQFLIPVAISLAGGVAFATLITLLVVPSLYMIVDDLTHVAVWVRRVVTGR